MNWYDSPRDRRRRRLRRLGIGVGIVVVFYVAAVWLTEPLALHPFFAAGEGVRTIAHRGGRQLGPENTIVAFELARAAGTEVLEMDVRGTADGVLVLMHDRTVERTTDGAGRVNGLDIDQVLALDAGYRWSVDGGASYPYRDRGVKVPRFEEVLRTFAGVPMVIEIKQQEPPIAEALCVALRAFGQEKQALVASGHGEALDRFRAACPEVATGAGPGEVVLFYLLNKLWLDGAYRPDAQALLVPSKMGFLQVVSEGFVDGAQEQGMAVIPWTINEEAAMERLAGMGVWGIITDRPDRLNGLLGKGGS